MITGLSVGVSTVSLIFGATPFTVPRTDDLIAAIREKDYERVERLINPVKQLEDNLKRFGDIEVREGYVLYKGEEISNGHVNRIFELTRLELPVDSVALNLNSLLRNPSMRVRRDYPRFVDIHNLPFTEAGQSIFCKAVRADFLDIHSGTVNWAPGQKVSMPREKVDDDPTSSCSHGLHVCAPPYLPHFARADGHILNVAVWPENIVAFPIDYENMSKLRVCEADSLSIMPAGDAAKYYSDTGPIFALDIDEDDELSLDPATFTRAADEEDDNDD